MAPVVDVADSIAYHAGFGVRLAERDLVETESVMALRLTKEQLDLVVDRTRSGSGDAFSMLS